MKKILICDDEPSILHMLQLFLKKEGYDVYTVSEGNKVLEAIDRFQPDLLLLDIMLPDISGLDVLKSIGQKYKLPTIMLTAKNDVIDKILGLEFGADDYVTKPFDIRELAARIRALMRRVEEVKEASTPVYTFKSLVIDWDKKTVARDGHQIHLTPKEFELLRVLAANPGKVISREKLLDSVWGYDYYGDTRVVDLQILRLRKKLELDPTNPEYIITVFGFGYKVN